MHDLNHIELIGAPAPKKAIPSSNDRLLDTEAVCNFFMIHESTLYRGIPARYPRPIKLGPKKNAWLRAECEAALAKMIADRDQVA